jgi:SiaC family regulatory phosphoprotein
MKAVMLKEGKDTPYLILDPAKKKFEMGGKCIPEDAESFFTPILLWLTAYSKTPAQETRFVFKLEYYNTVALRKFLEVFKLLDKIAGASIVWYMFDDDDDDLSHLIDMLKIPFEVKYFDE